MPTHGHHQEDSREPVTTEFQAIPEQERPPRVELRLGVGDSVTLRFALADTVELIMGDPASTEPLHIVANHDLPYQVERTAELLLVQPGAVSPDLRRGWCPMAEEQESKLVIGRHDETDEFDLGPEISRKHLKIELSAGPPEYPGGTRITNLGRNGTVIRADQRDIFNHSDGVSARELV
jgi:hypothetical protein